MNALQSLAAPFGRLLLSLMFITSGFNKISQYEGTQGYMDAMGVPGALLPLVILTEIVGGLFIVVGFQTRLAALALAGFTFISALLFHFDFSDQGQMINFMKNISITGGFLLLVAHGAGAYALDNRKKAE